jgi:sulfoquinovose isomerase
MVSPALELLDRKWIALASHRGRFCSKPKRSFRFLSGKLSTPLGGFYDLEDGGRPTAPGYGAAGKPARYLFSTFRIIHAYAIAYLTQARVLLSIAE